MGAKGLGLKIEEKRLGGKCFGAKRLVTHPMIDCRIFLARKIRGYSPCCSVSFYKQKSYDSHNAIAFTILNILDSFPSVQSIPEFSVCVAPTLSFFYQFLWILVLKLVHFAQEFAISDGTVCFTG